MGSGQGGVCPGKAAQGPALFQPCTHSEGVCRFWCVAAHAGCPRLAE